MPVHGGHVMRLTKASRHAIRRAEVISAIALALALGLTTSCRAGEQGVSALNPKVWPGAAVNTVILPYAYTGRGAAAAPDELGETGRQLTFLVHMKVLLGMAKYGSVGVTTLTTKDLDEEIIKRECDAVTVMKKILGRTDGAQSTVERRMGVILLWGYLFEEQEEIYVQSYAWFLRQETPDRVSLPIEGVRDELTGLLPDRAFAFSPRRLTRADMRNIAESFRARAQIYLRPDETSPVLEVVDDPDSALAYHVTGIQDGWLQISSLAGDLKGWMKAEADFEGLSIDQKMPELAFVDAVAGYLRYRIASDGTKPHENPDQVRVVAERSISRYEEHTAAGEAQRAPTPAAIAKILRGNLAILSSDERAMRQAVTFAGGEYAKAVELIPYDADARNLHAMTRIYLGHSGGWDGESAEVVSNDMLGALALDPDNVDALANLERFYTVLQQTSMDINNLDRKLAAVRRVRASLRGR